MKPTPLKPEPFAPAEDYPPKGQAAAVAVLGTLLLSFPAVAVILFASERSVEATGKAIAALIGLLIAALIVWLWRRVVRERGEAKDLPEIADVLRGSLGFKPSVFSGIYVAAFFHPVKASPGGATCLLIFMQNTMCRSRSIRIDLHRNSDLGVRRGRRLDLLLSAGEAVAYRIPLGINPKCRRKDLNFTLVVRQKSPTGHGARFPLIGGVKHASTTLSRSSAWTVLQPGLQIVPGMEIPQRESLPPEQFISVYVPHIGEARFDLLKRITETSAWDTVSIESLPPHPDPQTSM